MAPILTCEVNNPFLTFPFMKKADSSHGKTSVIEPSQLAMEEGGISF
jgi:hypothetical protein